MAKMSQKQTKVHSAFLGLKRPFNPTDIYQSMCKLMGLKEDAIERGLGKLFREDKLKSPDEKRAARAASRPRAGDDDGFR